MDSERPPTLLALSSYVAGHVSRIGHRALVEALDEKGLRLPHFAVLAALSDFGALAQHELADHLRLNTSHLVGYVDRLEQANLVQRQRDTRDRRKQHVSLTTRGTKEFGRLSTLARTSEATAFHSLSTAERRTLNTLLQRVVAGESVAPD